MVDRLVLSNGRVLCFANPPEAYTSRELLVYFQSTFNVTAIDILSFYLYRQCHPFSRPGGFHSRPPRNLRRRFGLFR